MNMRGLRRKSDKPNGAACIPGQLVFYVLVSYLCTLQLNALIPALTEGKYRYHKRKIETRSFTRLLVM